MRRRRAVIVSLAGLLVGAGAITALVLVRTDGGAAMPTPSLRDDAVMWRDEFNASAGPVGDRWTHAVGGDGWGNNELECYTDSPSNSSVDGEGHLVITARRAVGAQCEGGTENDWTSARLTTKASFSTSSGTLAIRAKIPTAPGTWPAFWALGADDDTVQWPLSGEIDVLEADGRDATHVLGSVHGPTDDGLPWAVSRSAWASGDLGRAFHTYAVEWTANRFTFSLDGVPYGSISRADVSAHGRWVFDKPYYLLVNLAVGGDFPGTPPASTSWPQKYVIDWVRVYSSD